jgi:hypothetical protein
LRRKTIKTNYLNNKDILKEIHKSKNSYCCYLDATCADYDIILSRVEDINQEKISEAIKNRSERLTKLQYELSVAESTEKKRLDDFHVKEEDIQRTDLVFRVMSWEHVPSDISKTNKAKEVDEDEDIIVTEYDDEDTKPTKYIKVNFPPFVHYKLGNDDQPYLVGKSHWKGSLIDGQFSKDHGKMTNKLAYMFIKLCERYATRSNWRGYTYNDEMRSQALLQLSQIGLQFDESKSLNPFAYYTAAITNAFTRVLNIEKRNQNLRDDILELNNLNPSYTRQNMFTGGGGYEE